jgi:hypothetical protein
MNDKFVNGETANNPTYEQLLVENIALREEVKMLRYKLGIEEKPPLQPEPQKMPNSFPEATVTQSSPPDEKINLFMSLFRGREDVYAKRWFSVKNKSSGYSPVCLNEWKTGVCNKGKHRCNKCSNRNFAKLSRNAVFAHLSGNSETANDVIGIYPMTEDEYCYFLAIDFDDDDWRRDITVFRKTCNDLELTANVERSRSGNGGHVWFFFVDKIPAVNARKFGSALLTEAMSLNHGIKFNSYDRLFPNQDVMPNGGFGNLIALPLQGLARKNHNSEFVDEDFNHYPDQWAFLSCVKKLSADTVDEYINKLCKNSELGTLSSIGKESEQKPWEKAKPQRTLTTFDFTETVKIVKANMLHVDKTGISSTALNQIKRLGAFRNPDFYKSQKMRLPIYDKPRIIDTSEETPQYLSIPRGCEDELLSLLESANAEYIIEDKRNCGIPIDVKFNGELYPEQELAATALLQHETGILSATTAFGKTVIGSYIISQRKVNTLVLVHTSALLEQWKKSLMQFLVINEALPEQLVKRGRKKELSLIGQLGSAKNTLNGKIDITIMQSLVSGDEVKELVKDYGLIIVDECHHVSAFSFEKILKTVNSKYIYGLTATPTRQDGHHPIICMQRGEIRYKVDAKEQAEKCGFERFIVPRFTPLKKPVGIEDKDFTITKQYAALAEGELRNRLIVSDVLAALEKGRTPIILARQVNHVKLLADMLEENNCNVFRLLGKASLKEKKERLEQIRNIAHDERFVIVATGKYVGEGFDEPRLDTLFLVAPVSWKGTLQQYAGRLHREHDSKESVIIYDYVDFHVKSLENMYHKRVSVYSGMGYKAISDNDDMRDNVGIIFDNRSFTSVFAQDVEFAKQEIVICSPYLRKSRGAQMMKLLSVAPPNGVRVIIITRPAESYKESEQPSITGLLQSLSDFGFHVITKQSVNQRFAVIDQNIVWYGSVNLLSYGSAEENIMRFENVEIAGELLITAE